MTLHRRESPWRLGGLSVRELARRTWAEFWEDQVLEHAAALSYYFLFALFPALLFLIALLGYMPVSGLQERLMAYVNDVLPPEAAETVRSTMSEILDGNHGGLLSIGVLLALWAGSNGMASVIAALNVAYDAEEWRPWWKRRLLAVVLTVAFTIFVVAALTLLVFGPKLAVTVAAWFGLGGVFAFTWNLVSVPTVLLCGLLGVELVYHLAPATRQRWRWVTPGAVLSLALWLAMSFGLRLYVQEFGRYNAMYGSIGGVILLMLWLYLTSAALLLGAEVNAEIEQAARQHGATTAADAPAEPAADRRRKA